jgi:fatty-acyl-CoA synthase
MIPSNTPLTLHMVFDRMRSVHATSRVIGADGTRTYGEVSERVERLAQALVSRFGVGPGTRVATFGFNSVRHLELYFAVPLVGAVLHTLNVRLHRDEIAQIVAHAEDEVILFDAELEERLAEVLAVSHLAPGLVRMGEQVHAALPRAIPYEELVAAARPIARFPVVPEDAVAGLCYSSGTTGRPKGVPTTHRALVLHSFATSMRDNIGIGEQDVVLPVVPMFHAFGWGLPYSVPFVGADLVLHGADSSPENLARTIDAHGVTIGAGVPTIWRSLVPLLASGRLAAQTLRLVFAGGSASPATLIDDIERHGIEYLQIWGMTETGPIACVSRPRRRHRGLDRAGVLETKERTGTIIPGLEARVVDEEGQLVEPDGQRIGELEVRGPWVITEYFGEDADERFHDGWLRTGDMSVMEPDGYLRIVDRSKDLVKSGGEWISSLQLEAAIRRHPDVADVAVVGVTSRRWDERPVAVVVPRDAEHPPDLASLHTHLEDLVARWWLPDVLVLVEVLPLTSVGKVDKRAIRRDLDLELD